ncbi:MAG: ribosomal RNA small subunit methyltransferase A [Phycisphaerales bacterium]|nr:ribosomal RNA small subunit methyltransferase A [Phycisphaerales bacterium]
MQTLTEIKSLLADRGLHPRHRLGQNFLHDHNLLRKLVDAADITPGDVVLEVGPGTGTLTEALLDAGAHVVACEIDQRLAQIVRDRLVGCDALTLVVGDCLASKHALADEMLDALRDAGGEHCFTLVANLPYQAASPLLATLLVHHPACIGMFITIQKEVADRITAQPGGKEYGTLSVLVQALATVQRIADCPPSCFWPQPKVTSSMLAIRRRSFDAGPGLRSSPAIAPFDPIALSQLLQRLFSKRRKQLGSILGRDVHFPADIDPAQRPEQLTVNQIITLLNVMPPRPRS